MSTIGPQFVRAEVFARKGRQGRPRLAGVIGEARRLPGFAPHVEIPREPTVVFGAPLAAVPDIIEARLAGATDRLGRKLPSTQAVMLGIVTSYPVCVATIEADPIARVAYEFWRALVVSRFNDRYGADLIAVIEHMDERMPHLHLWVVPRPDADGVFCLEKAFPPLAAQGDARRAGKSRAEQRARFREAAVEFQAWYYNEISIHCGLSRVGPQRPRRTHRAHHEARAAEIAAEKIAAAERETDRVKAAARALLNEAQAQIQNLDASINGAASVVLMSGARVCGPEREAFTG